MEHTDVTGKGEQPLPVKIVQGGTKRGEGRKYGKTQYWRCIVRNDYKNSDMPACPASVKQVTGTLDFSPGSKSHNHPPDPDVAHKYSHDDHLKHPEESPDEVVKPANSTLNSKVEKRLQSNDLQHDELRRKQEVTVRTKELQIRPTNDAIKQNSDFARQKTLEKTDLLKAPGIHVVSLNTHGLRKNRKRLNLFNKVGRMKYDVIFFQETHCKNDTESKKWSKAWEGHSIWNNGNSRSRGVAVLFRKNFDSDYKINDKWLDSDGRCICFTCRLENDQDYRFSNIYAPIKSKARKSFFNEILPQLQNYADSAIVIGGDFNYAQNVELDRWRSWERNADRADAGAKAFASLCDLLKIEDIWRRRNPKTKAFTFSSGGSNSRIDYFLSSKLIDIGEVGILSYFNSDHDFITLKINTRHQIVVPGYGC